MSFTITAELPLGTYRGAGTDGRPEPMPSVVRLHSALLSAAGFGPRAVADGEDLGPCETDDAALRWLEQHPPDGVVIPSLTVNRGEAVAYRDDGTIKQTREQGTTKKMAKPAGTSVAVAGRFTWIWSDPPPEPVRTALEALCRDVPYLGTSESPVRLTAGNEAVEPTHDIDRDAGPFTVGGVHVDACAAGRTDELVTAHQRRTRPARTEPRAAYGTDEWSLSDTPPREAVEPVRYGRRGQSPADVPWPRAMLVPLSRAVPERFRVAWAVAAHRALIKQLDDDAPPVVTGEYPDGMRRPANRVALHLLDSSAPLHEGAGSPGTLVVLLPAGAHTTEVELVAAAVDALRSVRGPGGRVARVVDRARVVPGAQFWAPPAAGHLRLWRTAPAAVPDTRGAHADQWTFTHAALLSLGFVWKSQLPPVSGRRDAYYRGLAQAVTDAGAAVVRTRPVRTSDVDRYAHRVNRHAVVRPYIADMWLGRLATAGTVAAIGQSRHLGGGLLVPYDVPEGVAPPDVDALPGQEGGPHAET